MSNKSETVVLTAPNGSQVRVAESKVAARLAGGYSRPAEDKAPVRRGRPASESK